MLREAVKAGAPLGVKAKGYMEKGALVPDDLVIALVAERLQKDDAKQGFILDGFPRTPIQAESLDRTLGQMKMPLELVLYFKTSVSVIVARLSGRRVCGQCGRIYHVVNSKPKAEGICDACGSTLVQRPDDRVETIENRLKVYEEQTAPLIEYFLKNGLLEEVSGDLDVERLSRVLQDLFERKGLKQGSGIKDRG